MVNTAIDYYRANIRRRTSDMEEASHVVSFDADAVSRFSEMEILEAVQQLSPAYRAVFNLFVIEGYSHKEISQLLDINESTSRSNLVKARLKLKEILLKQR
jgi:RNA polymerase sigma-70 factor (ECF subfamily)